MNIFLVIPTIRTLDFLKSWDGLLFGCNLIIVEDNKTKEVKTPARGFKKIYHYTWDNITGDFGSDGWIFSRQNAGIRSYGFWKAYQSGADIIITLDDDCYPVDRDFVKQHVDNLSMYIPDRWINTYPNRAFIYTRGMPYKNRHERKAVVSHGLWTNQIDLDAQTQLKHLKINLPSYPSVVQLVPSGVYFPMCSMNLAFSREATPLMYFPLMGKDPDGNTWGFDRFDDIWAGLFAKKIMDHLNLAAVNGSPFVEHRKASDIQKNLMKEKRGIAQNETLWRLVDKVVLTKKTPAACYVELAQKIRFPKNTYFTYLRRAMEIWASLF